MYVSNGFDLVATYNDLSQDNKIWRVFAPMLIVNCIICITNVVPGFSKSPPYYASDTCDFVNNCMPYPCGSRFCFPHGFTNNTMSSIIINNNNSSSDDTSLEYLPPIFQLACQGLLEGRVEEVKQWPMFS